MDSIIQPKTLTRPDETHHIVCCNMKQFRKEAILHGRIRLLNVSSLSHPKDVFYGGVVIIFRKNISWFQKEHVSSVLECSSNLSGIQGKLKLCLPISSFSFRVFLHSKRQKIIIVTDLKIWTTKCARANFVDSLIKRRLEETTRLWSGCNLCSNQLIFRQLSTEVRKSRLVPRCPLLTFRRSAWYFRKDLRSIVGDWNKKRTCERRHYCSGARQNHMENSSFRA